MSDFYFIEQKEPEAIHQLIHALIYERIPKRFGLHFPDDIQILTPMQKGPLGAQFLNNFLQSNYHTQQSSQLAISGKYFRTHDKVMQIVNNYDKQVYNGDIGRIIHIDEVSKRVVVSYQEQEVTYEQNELDELVLAYATTVHKAQGSEFKAVIMPVSMSHYVMLERNLIYTAMTRARQLLILVGDTKALKKASRTLTAYERCTHLSNQLDLAMRAVCDNLTNKSEHSNL